MPNRPPIVDPFAVAARQASPERPPIVDPFAQEPTIPKHLEKKAKNSVALASGLDIPVEQAYTLHDEFVKQTGEASLWERSQASFKVGLGGLYSSVGNALKHQRVSERVPGEEEGPPADFAGVALFSAGEDLDSLENISIDYGNRLKTAYIPPTDKSEFTWGKLLSAEYLANTVPALVPFAASLVPAGVIGGYLGSQVAGAYGLGLFGTLVLKGIGAGILVRPIESAMEAGNTFEEAKKKGFSDLEAKAAADQVFNQNMLLAGLDAAQIASALAPLVIPGSSGTKVFWQRAIAAGVKLTFGGVSEFGEERLQEKFQIEALGGKADFFDLKNPRLNEAGGLGLIGGLGLGGAGSVFTFLTEKVTENMPPEVSQTFNETKKEATKQGATKEQAEIVALDAVADTEEGAKHIEKVVEEIKEPPVTKGPVAEEVVAKSKEADEVLVDDVVEGRKDIEEVIQDELDFEAAQAEEIASAEQAKAQVEKTTGASKTSKVKADVRKATGQVKEKGKLIAEREALKASFTKAAQNARIAFRVGNKEGVEKQKVLMRDALAKIKGAKERAKVIKQIKKATKPKGKIAVDYQKKIQAVLSGFDFTKPTEKKLGQLKSLKKFIDENGVPLEISSKNLKELDRLAKKPISDLSTKDLESLRDELKKLEAAGKLKSEMQYKYDASQQAAKLKEITDTTANFDPKVNLGGLRDQARVAAEQFYIDTLHTPRVTDRADGFQDYKGAQAGLEKQQGRAVQEAIKKSTDRGSDFLKFLKEQGVTSIEEGSESDIRMNIVMRQREGARKQAKNLMDKHGIKEVPILTEQEEKIIDYILKDMERHKPDLRAAWEETKDSIFQEQETYYLPLKYERERGLAPDPSGKRRGTDTFSGFGHARQLGVNKLPRVGIIQIYQEAVNEQEWFKSIQPVIEDIKSVVLTPGYREAAGDLLAGWWADDLDILANRGWSSSAQMTAVTNLLGTVRHNIATGILAYKLSTVVLQPFAVFDAMAYVHTRFGAVAAGKVLGSVTKSFVQPGYAKSIIEGSEALKQREGGELTISEELASATGSSIKEKLTKAGFGLIVAADVRTAAGVQQAVKDILIKEGLTETEAKQEAEFVMELTQASSNVAYRPHILSKGEGARTWFTFQTFIMNRWGLIVHDIAIGKIGRGKAKEKLAGIVALGILMMGGLTEDEARKIIWEFISRRKLNDKRGVVGRAFMNVIQPMPFFGQFIEAASRGNFTATAPALRTFSKGLEGLFNITKTKGLLNAIESSLILGVGFPGTAQFFDILEGSMNEKTTRSLNRRSLR